MVTNTIDISKIKRDRGRQLLALRRLRLQSVVSDGATISAASLKAVLRTIDDHVDYSKPPSTCWASVETIAYETCLSDKTVRRAIRSLIELGYVVPFGRNQGKTGELGLNWDKITTSVIITEVDDNTTSVTLSPTSVTLSPTSVTLSPTSVTVTDKTKETKETKKKREGARAIKFSPPTLDDVKAIWTSAKLKGSPEEFYLYYEANGWTTGARSKPMQKWTMAAHKWSVSQKKFETNRGIRKVNLGPGVNYDPKRSTENVEF